MNVKIISKPGCPACVETKSALLIRGIEYEEDVRDTPEGFERFIAEGHRTFPRVFIDGELIGGNYELQQHLRNAQAAANDDDF